MKSIILLTVCLFSRTKAEIETTTSFEITEPSSPKLWLSESSKSSSTTECKCVPYYLCVEEEGMTDSDRDEESKKCDFLQRCCVVANDTASFAPSNKEVLCGQSRGKKNVTDHKDNEAMIDEYPWMVALLRTKENETFEIDCGASLIHPQVVLTGAHCVYNKSHTTYKIRAGEWDIRSTAEILPHQDRTIKEVIIHPKYHNGALFYNFALLVLESPLEITDSVDVVCLPKENVVLDNLFCYASGWGKEEFDAKKPNTPILKKIGLPIVDRDTCVKQLRKTRLGSYFKLHESFICAGGQVGVDTCKGDGGGPLVCQVPGHRKKFYQAGVVSWGINCGKEVPGVYADVSKVIGWIDDTMNSFKFDTSTYRY